MNYLVAVSVPLLALIIAFKVGPEPHLPFGAWGLVIAIVAFTAAVRETLI
ncbi:hypothetical protein ACMX25_12265 [Caballeronia sp. 15715]